VIANQNRWKNQNTRNKDLSIKIRAFRDQK
jgi:hypothetical protein